jgi:hypothetical protein
VRTDIGVNRYQQERSSSGSRQRITTMDHNGPDRPARGKNGIDTMSATKILMTLALLAGIALTANVTATPSLAQSQPNYGPNSPGGGDTYGEPYSGSAAARRRSGGW